MLRARGLLTQLSWPPARPRSGQGNSKRQRGERSSGLSGGCPVSSKGAAHHGASRAPESAGFITEEQSRPVLLLVVQRGSHARDGADACSHTEASVIVCR